MHINALPPELLVRIFSYIDDFSDKIALERVCRHWCQIVPLDWKITKTCRKPLVDQETFDHVMNRCGEWLEELWLRNANFTEESVNRIHQRMKCLKHLKLSKCKFDGPAVNSIANLLGQKLYSFILDGTAYLPNMRRLIENESSKLEHLQIHLGRKYSDGTLPTKLPNNLNSFSLRTSDRFYTDSLILMSNVAKNCKNLNIFHLETYSLTPNMIMAIAGIKSLVYLNLTVALIQNEDALQNVICRELPNLKALDIDYCKQDSFKETVSNICRDRPDLMYLNVFAWHPFQISESLNSLTLRIENPRTVDFGQFLPGLLFEQQKNVSIQHLDIRELILPPSSNFIKLLGQFPNLKTIHCKLPSIYTDLTTFFYLIGKNLENGRNITIYFHDIKHDVLYYKYILPYDFPQFKAGWRPKLCNGKCENFVLKKLIKEAIAGRNEPSFLDEYWME